jgi:hypothetical protein
VDQLIRRFWTYGKVTVGDGGSRIRVCKVSLLVFKNITPRQVELSTHPYGQHPRAKNKQQYFTAVASALVYPASRMMIHRDCDSVLLQLISHHSPYTGYQLTWHTHPPCLHPPTCCTKSLLSRLAGTTWQPHRSSPGSLLTVFLSSLRSLAFINLSWLDLLSCRSQLALGCDFWGGRHVLEMDVFGFKSVVETELEHSRSAYVIGSFEWRKRSMDDNDLAIL